MDQPAGGLSALKRYQRWWSHLTNRQRWQWLGVGLATIFGAVYRLAFLRQTLQFLADQGRDSIIAYLVAKGDFTLVGPSTSVGDMYLGPLYYYFMVPWQWLAGWDPLGPALAVAIIGVVTVPLLYLVGKKLIGPTPAFIATLLYSFAPQVAAYTRFSWNPNPAPIVSLWIIYSVWKAWQSNNQHAHWWWVSAFLAWLVIIQLHYVALVMLAPIGIFWLADMGRTFLYRSVSSHEIKKAKTWRQHILSIAVSILLLFISFVPLIIFNWKFDNIIWRGFADFFQGAGNPDAIPWTTKLLIIIKEQEGRAMQALFELWGGKDWISWYRPLNIWLLRLYTITLVLTLWIKRQSKYFAGVAVLAVSIIFSILGLAVYRGTVHYHYFTFFFPLSYLLTGLVLVQLRRWFKFPGWLAASGLFIYITALQVLPSSLMYLKPLGWSIDKMEAVSDKVLEVVPADQSYMLTALTHVRDYRGLNYRYFLVISDHPPVNLEDFAQADLLVIIAESPQDPELVLNSNVYEIETFPVGNYQKYENVAGEVTVYVVERAQQ